MRFNFLLASALTLTLIGSGCGNGVRPETRDTVRFSALETDEIGPQILDDPGPSASPQQLSTYEPIVQGVRDSRKELFARADVGGQLERIEGVFISTGEYLELVSYYQQHVEEAGPNDDVGRRLAWALIRLGQMKQARDLIDELMELSPRDPLVHFLDGSYYLQTEGESVDDRKKALAGWERTVELDPDFRGYEGITAAVMKNQMQQMRASIPPEEAEESGGEADAPEAKAVAAARGVLNTANGPVGDDGDAVAGAEPSDGATAEGEQPEPAEEASAAAEIAGNTEIAENAENAAGEAAERPGADSDREYKVLVARGEIALSQKKFEEAETFFIEAKKVRPDGFAAELGQLQAGWGVESARNVVSSRARKLAERDLSGEESLRLGRFVWTRMQDRQLATKLLEDAKKKAPDRAAAADKLLDAMK